MNHSFRAWTLIIFSLSAVPGFATVPQGSFTAGGHLLALEAEIPASVTWDEEAGLLRIDVAGETPAAVLVNWRSPSGVYFVAGDRCRRSAVPEPGLVPEAAASVSEAMGPPGDSLRFVRESADGPLYLLLESEPFALTVKLDAIGPLRRASAASIAIPANCDGGGFTPIAAPKAVPDAVSPPAPLTDPWIATNNRWTKGMVDWVAPTFRQTKVEYNAQFQKCLKDPNNCRQYYAIDAKYGWHCGPGWGKGQDYWLDPVDAVCRYHDAQKWGSSDWQGWCGMWHALFCWSQSWPFAWMTNFPDSEEAYRYIRLAVNTLAFFHGCRTCTC